MGEETGRLNDVLKIKKELVWETDYEKGVRIAKSSSKNLLIYFTAGTPSEKELTFETQTLGNEKVAEALGDRVLLKLPLLATIPDPDGKQVPLMKQEGFVEMKGFPGLIEIDFSHMLKPYYGKVVGALPFFDEAPVDVGRMQAFASLPEGTLTQRTLIYAIRIHPDRPQSTSGQFDPDMSELASEHSRYMARVSELGHQDFSSRFERISSQRKLNHVSEVVAMYCSNATLLQDAIGCVDAWRNSPKHWESVGVFQAFYGYDMARGKEGCWYATGIFAR